MNIVKIFYCCTF